MRPPGFIARLSPPFGRKSWSCTPRAGWRSVISPTFFSYGIFLPFWSVWLAGNGLTPETIGILLGAGLVARFLGSLLIAPRVSDPSRLITALRVLALLTLLFALAFLGRQPRSMAAGDHHRLQPVLFAAGAADGCSGQYPGKKQITMDYGRVRLWGSIAFVIGSALTGKLVSLFDYRAILLMLSLGGRLDAARHAA